MVCLRSITDSHNTEGDQRGCWREHGTVICTRDAKDHYCMAGLWCVGAFTGQDGPVCRGGGVCAERRFSRR